jgi:Rifampin ADP-ribosyl transferase
MPNNKRGAGYDEGAGFDQKPMSSGFQQGTLFRREAPARANLHAERDHLGPTPEDQARYIRHRDFGAYNKPPDPNTPKPEEYDLRQLKGRVPPEFKPQIEEGLYHGTAARLQPGSMLRPGQKPNFGAIGDNWGNGQSADTKRENVFATADMANAFRYSQNAREMRESGPHANVAKGNARAHVYQVQPTGPVSFDKEDTDARMGYKDPSDSDVQFQSKSPLRVLHPVQFSDAQEAYRSRMEDDYGEEPGNYQYAPRVRQQGLW